MMVILIFCDGDSVIVKVIDSGLDGGGNNPFVGNGTAMCRAMGQCATILLVHKTNSVIC